MARKTKSEVKAALREAKSDLRTYKAEDALLKAYDKDVRKLTASVDVLSEKLAKFA